MRRYAKRAIPDRELDKLCREIVFRRDEKCVKCGKRDRLQWCHVYSRSKKAMRWEPDNSMVLCAGCHLWWHHKPLEAIAWFTEKYPDRAKRLTLMAQTPRKIDRQGIVVSLKQGLENG